MRNYFVIVSECDRVGDTPSERIHGVILVSPFFGEVRRVWEDGVIEIRGKDGTFKELKIEKLD